MRVSFTLPVLVAQLWAASNRKLTVQLLEGLADEAWLRVAQVEPGFVEGVGHGVNRVHDKLNLLLLSVPVRLAYPQVWGAELLQLLRLAGRVAALGGGPPVAPAAGRRLVARGGGPGGGAGR